MAFGVACKAVKDNIAVDLAERGVGRGKRSQHRAVNGGGAVGPGQCLGEVPQNPPGIFSGGRRPVAEDLVAAVLNGGAIHVDEDGGVQGGNDIDTIELRQRNPGTIEIAAVQGENVQRLIAAGQVQLVEHHLAGAVGSQGTPEIGGTLQIPLRLGKINGGSNDKKTVGVAHGVVDNRTAGVDYRVAAGVGACGNIDIAIDHKGRVRVGRRQRKNAGANAVVAQGGIAPHRNPAFCIGVAHIHVAKDKYVIVVGKAEIECHSQSSYWNCTD